MSQNRVIDPRAAERRRSILLTVAAVLVLALIAVVVIVVIVNRGNDESRTGGSDAPSVVTPDGAIRVTSAPKDQTPPVIINVVEDFQCPACGMFEKTGGPVLASYHDNPKVAIDYQTLNMLDRGSIGYSTRSANAAMCVAEATGKDGDMNKWLEYHNILFANQPTEGGAGLSDSKLISLAKDSGIDGITDCVEGLQFSKWIDENSKKIMSAPDFQGTPQVKINGTVVEWQNTEDMKAKIDAAIEAAQ